MDPTIPKTTGLMFGEFLALLIPKNEEVQNWLGAALERLNSRNRVVLNRLGFAIEISKVEKTATLTLKVTLCAPGL
jgi:hypothetical protein